jgi:Sulfatase
VTSARPNILLITSDQQRADCVGFENRHLRTPHLDQLAREGTRFSANMSSTRFGPYDIRPPANANSRQKAIEGSLWLNARSAMRA